MTCDHYGAKILAKLTRVPIYRKGKVIDERLIIGRDRVCPTCGTRALEPLVSTARTEDPTWKPSERK